MTWKATVPVQVVLQSPISLGTTLATVVLFGCAGEELEELNIPVLGSKVTLSNGGTP